MRQTHIQQLISMIVIVYLVILKPERTNGGRIQLKEKVSYY